MVLAVGFYEGDKHKQPYPFVLKSGEPSATAGIYAQGETESDPMAFTILTTEANNMMRPIHDRMPVMLMAGHEEDWLPPGGFSAREAKISQPSSGHSHCVERLG
jgi:putative SOS response-associated peptidase YedK